VNELYASKNDLLLCRTLNLEKFVREKTFVTAVQNRNSISVILHSCSSAVHHSTWLHSRLNTSQVEKVAS